MTQEWQNNSMGNIYRKASLDRLSSPEQLDKMIRIASPSLWISVVGAGLVVACVLVWALFGKLPDNVSVSGLYMSNTEVQGAYASYGGKVQELRVKKDQQVQAGDVIAVIVNEDSKLAMDQLKERIAGVEAVTLTSENDQATSDNSQLLEYKQQYKTAGMTVEQKQKSLEALQKELVEANKKLETCRANMEAAEQAYLASIGGDGTNAASFNYQLAQTRLQEAQTVYEAAAANVSSLESAYNTAEDNLASLKTQYSELQSEYQSLLNSYNAQMAQLSSCRSQRDALAAAQNGGGSVSDFSGDSTGAVFSDSFLLESGTYDMETEQNGLSGDMLSAGSGYDYSSEIAALDTQIASLETSTAELSSQLTTLSDSLRQMESGISSQEGQTLTLSTQLAQAQTSLQTALSNMQSANSAYKSAQKNYGNYYASQSDLTATQTKLNTAFSEASTLYSNAYSQQQSIEQQIKEMQLNMELETDSRDVNKESLEEQFDAAKKAILKDLNTELNNLKAGGAEEEIVAGVTGTILDCTVEEDQIIGQGTEIVKIKAGVSGDSEDTEIIRCYVPIATGKKLKAGMSAVVTPSTVSEQEYGHMMASVVSVGTYTVTTSEMQRMLGNDAMVSATQQQGPCVEVLIALEKDETTASGYAWSNSKGRTVTLEENTPISAKVRIKEDAPISKLIPFLKSKLDVKVDSGSSSN